MWELLKSERVRERDGGRERYTEKKQRKQGAFQGKKRNRQDKPRKNKDMPRENNYNVGVTTRNFFMGAHCAQNICPTLISSNLSAKREFSPRRGSREGFVGAYSASLITPEKALRP